MGFTPVRREALNTSCGEFGGHMQAVQAGVGHGAAHEGHVPGTGEADVADELAVALQVALVFLARERGADSLRFPHRVARLHAEDRIREGIIGQIRGNSARQRWRAPGEDNP